MRGSRQPAVRPQVTQPQGAFRALSRHRRSKLALAAQTTLVKAHQWARGEAVASDVATSLESALAAFLARAKKA